MENLKHLLSGDDFIVVEAEQLDSVKGGSEPPPWPWWPWG